MIFGVILAAATLAQQTQSFTVFLKGSISVVTPLFGPIREAEWAPGWAPHFVNPAEGAQREGVVFTTKDAQGKERIWVVTDYDANEGRIGYAFVTPGFAVPSLGIRFKRHHDGRRKETVTYSFMAMVPEATDYVNQHDAHWAQQQRQ